MVPPELADLRRAEARRRTVMDSLFSFVGLLAPDGTLIEANRATLDAARLDGQEVLGLHFADLPWWAHDATVHGQLRAAIDDARAGRASRFDIEVELPGGGRVALDFQLVPIIEDGVVTALVPSGIDITDRVLANAQMAAFARIAQAVNTASTPEDVAAIAAQGAGDATSGMFANVALVDDERDLIRLHNQAGLPTDVAERWSEMPREGTTPIQQAIRTGQPLHVDPRSRQRDHPELVGLTERLGIGSTTTLPLLRSDRTVVGALGVAWPTDRPPTQRDHDQLQALADLVAQGIERAQLAQVRHRLVRELHDQLLRPPPDLAGLDLAVRYRAAAHGLGFGGDWYEVIELSPTRTAVVVGDVVGHDVEAAARMAHLQTLVGTLLRQGIGLEELFERVDDLVTERSTGFIASAAVAVVDLDALEVRYVRAGHPPPLLRRAAGPTVLLDGGHVPVIGWRPAETAVGRAAVEAGDALVLYTDGLIERPGINLDASIDQARTMLSDGPDDGADDLADRLMGLLADGPQRDDAVVAVCRIRPPSGA